MNSRYSIDFNRLVLFLIPAALALPSMVAWLSVLVFPLKWAYDYIFTPFVDSIIFRASITSSVCRLEFMLNSIFYPDGLDVAYNRRIVIVKVQQSNSTYIYLGDGGSSTTSGGIDGQPIEENQEVPLFKDTESSPVFIYTDAELGYTSGVDYVVKIPQPEVGNIDLSRMRAMINANQLPDKIYQIVSY